MTDTAQYEVVWSGGLYKQDEAHYSLLGSGWQIREHVLQAAALNQDAYPSKAEIRRVRLQVAGSWRKQAAA